MECATARHIIRISEGPCEPSEELVLAQRHMSACPQCGAWRKAQRGWRDALQEKLPRLETPLEVKERLFETLARARADGPLGVQRQRSVWAVLSVGLAAMLVALVWVSRETTQEGLLLAAVTEDHLLSMARSTAVEFSSDDAATVARWFTGRVDFAVMPHRLQGADLLGGRLCTLADRRAALWIFQRGTTRVSLFQLPAQDLRLGSLHPMSAEGRSYLCGHRKGMTVLAWTERDVLFALVSELPEDDMLRLTAGMPRG